MGGGGRSYSTHTRHTAVRAGDTATISTELDGRMRAQPRSTHSHSPLTIDESTLAREEINIIIIKINFNELTRKLR